MKKYFIAIILLSVTSFAYSQPRNAGQAVVPKGWENQGPIRWGFYDDLDPQTDSLNAPLDDSLGVNILDEWGARDASTPVYGAAKGYVAPGIMNAGDPLDMTAMGKFIKQRIFTPAPNFNDLTRSFYWRYNDLYISGSGAIWHDSEYDANDISPYAEYPPNPVFVDSIVAQGNEGRVILGYSDQRVACPASYYNSLVYTRHDYPFQPDTNGTKAFSVILEFNLDTASIITTGSSVPTDSIPLLKFQVLFKKAGESIKPFVPFKTSADTATPVGWYALVDTMITKSIYRNLMPDWRSPDTLASGSQARAWGFKQLHIVLKCPMASYNNLIYGDQNSGGGWGGSSEIGNDTQFTQPDLITEYDSNSYRLSSTDSASSTPLIEIRVLSMYRDTVRIRDVTWQDTAEDKFFYRKRITPDSTHSLNPNDSIGGYDDSLRAYVNYIAGLKPDTVQREVLHSDWAPFSSLSASICALLDWHLSSRGMATHIHEQDHGNWTKPYRRERMSFDGQTPSLFENQDASYGSERAIWWVDLNVTNPIDVFPSDYVYYARHVSPTVAWPDTTQDYMMGLIIGRHDTSSTLKAYQNYSFWDDDPGVLRGLRTSTYIALHHPPNKRFAIETNIQGWGLTDNRAWQYPPDTPYVWHFLYPDTLWWGSPATVAYAWQRYYAHYDQRPTTPEETSAIIYGALAEGVTSFSDAQVYDVGLASGGAPGVFGVDSSSIKYTNPSFVHNYNFGNRRSWWYDPHSWTDSLSNHLDGPLPPYYLGYSNTWRAMSKANQRINQIWDTVNGNLFPAKKFEWLDAYSNSHTAIPSSRLDNPNFNPIPGGPGWQTMSPQDSLSKVTAFLKVVKTSSVKRWTRNSDKSYIDSTDHDTLVYDVDTVSRVEVGLFRQNVSGSYNYAALLVNTRLWPSLRDADDSGYYNAGFESANDSIQRCRSTLGDIDVRKVYLKLDLTKTNTTFASNTYFVVRDLWHPDSTWLLHKDSTFAVYIKPGDAKFLYFQPGIGVNVAARTGTNIGQSTDTEFGFNNGRRIAEIMHGTRDIVTYTRNHKLYVAYPAIGRTFGGSPDQSSGDNIITGNEIPIDTSYLHFCARPSICPAQNDTGVALTWWYRDTSGIGHVAFAYRKDTASSWYTVVYSSPSTWFIDTTYDLSWVTPVLTPIDDTAWLLAAGVHIGNADGAIVGIVVITPLTGSPHFSLLPHVNLAQDIDYGDTTLYATFPTLSSRPFADTPWTVRFAYQQETVPNHHEIYFSRWKHLLSSFPPIPDGPESDGRFCVSQGLAACDNLHPSLATNGTVEQALWYGRPVGFAKFYHDYLAWESRVGRLDTSSGDSYWPVVRVRHEEDTPVHTTIGWSVFDVFKVNGVDHYPQVSADFRTYNGLFSSVGSPRDSSHDWIRMVYSLGGQAQVESWAPNWFHRYFHIGGLNPTVPQSTGNSNSWPDSGAVPRSIAWFNNNIPIDYVDVTNGYLTGVTGWTGPNLVIIPWDTESASCPTVTSIKFYPTIILPPSGPPTIVNWDPISPSFGGPDEAWSNPENIPNIEHSDAFVVNACDSILIPRVSEDSDLGELQDSLKSGSDYVMFRMTLCNKADSSWLGTIDSMIVTKTTIYWAGASILIDPDNARYEMPCTASPDSAFISIEVLRGDTTNSIQRYYVNFLDTDIVVPAAKRSTKPAVLPSSSGIRVTVHPNPSSLTTKICVEDLPEGEPAMVQIYNALGESITTLYNATPEAELGLCLSLDCSRIPSGTYYARVVNDIMGTTVKFSVEH